ncbi:MAG: hypothetical protein R2735_02140 [Microthrixaceae bacterium]
MGQWDRDLQLNTGAVSVAGVEVIGDGTIGLRLALRINAGYWVGATASVRMQAMSSSGDCVNDPVENAVFTSTEPFVLHPVGWPLFVDQSNISDSSSYTDYVDGYSCDGVTWDSEVAQTFTADFTGRIAKVSLVARPISPNSSPLRVTIRPLDSDGSPGNSILGSGTYSGAGSSDTTTPIEVALTQPADVISTNEYAIVVSVPAVTACPTQSTYGWYVQGNGDSYAPGSVWSRGSLFNQSNWKQEPDHDLLSRPGCSPAETQMGFSVLVSASWVSAAQVSAAQVSAAQVSMPSIQRRRFQRPSIESSPTVTPG